MHPEDVVDTADAKTLEEESKFSVDPGTADTLVHSTNDVSCGQELVRNGLTGSLSNSECSQWPPSQMPGAPRLSTLAGPRPSSVDNKITSLFCGFRSAPILSLAASNSCRLDGTKIG